MVYGNLIKENDNIIKITNFNLEESLNEDTISKDSKIGSNSCMIYVNMGNEGNYIPHFHIKSNSTNTTRSIDCCVCIYKACFFVHNNHDKILNHKEIKDLIKVLKSKGKYTDTIWGDISYHWTRAFGKNEYYTSTMPDYNSKMPTEYSK